MQRTTRIRYKGGGTLKSICEQLIDHKIEALENKKNKKIIVGNEIEYALHHLYDIKKMIERLKIHENR